MSTTYQEVTVCLDVGLENSQREETNSIIYTQDIDSNVFFLDLKKNGMEFDEVSVLFKSENLSVQIQAESAEKFWKVCFDTSWIKESNVVTAYVYAKKEHKRYDVGSFAFNIAVSEIDKSIEKVEVVYWKQLDDLLGELREGVATGKIVGQSAYDLWIQKGNKGEVTDFLASLEGKKGTDGASNYELWLNDGNEGTVSDYLNWVRLNDSNFWVKDDVQKEIEELSDKYEQR